jgi:hypothetical protein
MHNLPIARELEMAKWNKVIQVNASKAWQNKAGSLTEHWMEEFHTQSMVDMKCHLNIITDHPLAGNKSAKKSPLS